MYDGGRGSVDGRQAEEDVSPAEVSRGCPNKHSRGEARDSKREQRRAGRRQVNCGIILRQS